METWPNKLPLPAINFGINTSSNSIRTTMDSGVIRQRRRFTVEQVFAQATWELSDKAMTILIAFLKYKVNLGNDSFFMDLPLGGQEGAVTHVVRFVEGKFTQQYSEGGFWDVAAELEILPRLVITEAALDTHLAAGDY